MIGRILAIDRSAVKRHFQKGADHGGISDAPVVADRRNQLLHRDRFQKSIQRNTL
jgi:hypothetical protein